VVVLSRQGEVAGGGGRTALQLHLQELPTPSKPIQELPLNMYKQESDGARVIRPSAGDGIFAVSARVIKKPLLGEDKSNKADEAGAAPVALIPTFCAKERKPHINIEYVKAHLRAAFLEMWIRIL
jgi:hypothetical protein